MPILILTALLPGPHVPAKSETAQLTATSHFIFHQKDVSSTYITCFTENVKPGLLFEQNSFFLFLALP